MKLQYSRQHGSYEDLPWRGGEKTSYALKVLLAGLTKYTRKISKRKITKFNTYIYMWEPCIHERETLMSKKFKDRKEKGYIWHS